MHAVEGATMVQVSDGVTGLPELSSAVTKYESATPPDESPVTLIVALPSDAVRLLIVGAFGAAKLQVAI